MSDSHQALGSSEEEVKAQIRAALANLHGSPSRPRISPGQARPQDGIAQATRLQQLDHEAERKKLENEDLKTDTVLKRHYAYWFIGILIGQLLLLNVVFIGVGVGCLKFNDYALHLYMGGTLAEVFGVVLVITKYLFTKRAAK